MFILVPAEEARWTRRDAFIVGRTDNVGKFKIKGAPGEYLLIAAPTQQNSFTRLDDFKKRAPQAPHVFLRFGTENPVEVLTRMDSP